jgi:hypothetical protein
MNTLPTELRNKLEQTCIAARNLAERAANDALKALAVHQDRSYESMSGEQRKLREKLRAHAKQLGDERDERGNSKIEHLAQECAYEHWHRMLFARFLAENNLLIEPDMGVAVSLDEVKELAKDAKTNLWALAGRYAQTMLPEIFRADDPVLQVPLAREDQIKLEQLLDTLAKDTFTAGDSLGWCYQFWQTERKDQINAAGNKIGADELPSVTQLFTEDYMVDFLLDNTLGAWWAGKVLAASLRLAENAKSEDELRKVVALPGCSWKFLRFIKGKDGKWTPAAGTFDGWPKTAKELKCLDPCMGSGHFVVAMFERLVALRMSEEKLDEATMVAAVIRDNLFGLEIDPRCTQIGAFNLALAAWRRVGHRKLPAMNLACSGLVIGTTKDEWIKILADEGSEATPFRFFFGQLYDLFQKSPVLGSLINPKRVLGGGMLSKEQMNRLMELLGRAIELTTSKPERHELGVAAQGIAKATEILAGQFTLVATNVPYLGAKKQDDVLKDYCERVYPEAKADLATCFVERSLDFCASKGSTALVTPQNWLFLGKDESLRRKLLPLVEWDLIARLGPKAFQTPMWDFNVMLIISTQTQPSDLHQFAALDVSVDRDCENKSLHLAVIPPSEHNQISQLKNPDARIISADIALDIPKLAEYCTALSGAKAGDLNRFTKCFWEIPAKEFGGDWEFYQTAPRRSEPFVSREMGVFWQKERGEMFELAQSVKHLNHVAQNWLRGKPNWKKHGVVVGLMAEIPATIYSGEIYDSTCCAIIPNSEDNVPALWAFCESGAYSRELRKLDQALNIGGNTTLLQVPFDLAHWQKVAAEKYPHGLPKPFSSDPTQWLFNGQPKGSDQPLQVAVARLVGYQWPRQTGSSFPDCPALGPDGLEKLADDDGIVCLPSVRGESPAAERLRQLLQMAYGKDWKAQTELELIRASGSDAADLEEWLRNDFFDQHCDVFHQSPFVWHIWDGRKRDGFHALVNYHVLASGDKGRRTLENLTHSYLGDWITRQKDGIKRDEEGADERLAAALVLKEKLEAILVGEPPFDVFVRWKSLAHQAVGWQPDINDGVRMNIRPFMAADIAGGKKGAGVMRIKPNIKWDKDRGKDPHRAKEEFPWLWSWDEQTIDFAGGREFDGNRWNDCHYANKVKQAARSHSKK